MRVPMSFADPTKWDAYIESVVQSASNPMMLGGIPHSLNALCMWRWEKDFCGSICFFCEAPAPEGQERCETCERKGIQTRVEYLRSLLSISRGWLKREHPQPDRAWRQLYLFFDVENEMTRIEIRERLSAPERTRRLSSPTHP